jgi:hypothetical protein
MKNIIILAAAVRSNIELTIVFTIGAICLLILIKIFQFIYNITREKLDNEDTKTKYLEKKGLTLKDPDNAPKDTSDGTYDYGSVSATTYVKKPYTKKGSWKIWRKYEKYVAYSLTDSSPHYKETHLKIFSILDSDLEKEMDNDKP